jgi:hypothetical protein
MRQWMLGLPLLVWACQAQAQQPMLAPSEVLACMTPAAAERGKPEYDPELVQRKIGGTVKAELVFSDPDAAPRVRPLHDENGVSRQLEDAVLQHVKKLRVPCQARGAEPARVVMEYRFDPTDGRQVWSMPPLDAKDAERRLQVACVQRIVPVERPEYPESAAKTGDSGRVLIRMRFERPDAPPVATVVAGPSNHALRRTALDLAPGFRLPCLKAGPIDVDFVVHFRIEGEATTVLKDMPLRTLLGAARSVPKPVSFDTRSMACPFDVRLSLFQPHAPNGVYEVGERNPERREFLHWLANLELKLEAPTLLKVLGDTFTVSVPCATINL